VCVCVCVCVCMLGWLWLFVHVCVCGCTQLLNVFYRCAQVQKWFQPRIPTIKKVIEYLIDQVCRVCLYVCVVYAFCSC